MMRRRKSRPRNEAGKHALRCWFIALLILSLLFWVVATTSVLDGELLNTDEITGISIIMHGNMQEAMQDVSSRTRGILPPS
jgi:hypothetical protein